MKKVIVSSPASEYYRYDNLMLHNLDIASTPEKAILQHNDLKKALNGAGCEVVDIPELQGHPNSVFTRDMSVCVPNGYIHLLMGLISRRGEEDRMARILDKSGLECLGKIEPPGTAEGGDVILAGNIAFIGNSRRTNLEGGEQLAGILASVGYEVRRANVPQPFLHLGGAMSFISPDRILCCDNIFPDDLFSGFERITIPMNDFISGNVICVRENEVIAEMSNVSAIYILQRSGCRIIDIDLSEFIKGNGGPSCLIMPVE